MRLDNYLYDNDNFYDEIHDYSGEFGNENLYEIRLSELYWEKEWGYYHEENEIRNYEKEYDDFTDEFEDCRSIEETRFKQDNIVELKAILTQKQIDQLKLHEKKMEIGNLGEEYVYQFERNKLKGTIYYNKIDKSKADDPRNGYDILSFTRNGDPLYIEVKTTSKQNGTSFEISKNELEVAESKGKKYIVYFIKDIYSNPMLEKIENLYDKKHKVEPTNFKFTIG